MPATSTIAADAWLVATTTRDDIDVDVDLGLDRHEALTARELEVLELLAQGLANKSIALRLGISDQTVKFHVASICGKLGAVNRTDAARRALRRGMISPFRAKAAGGSASKLSKKPVDA